MISLLASLNVFFNGSSIVKDDHDVEMHMGKPLQEELLSLALLEAAKMGDEKEVRSLLGRVSLTVRDKEGNTPLHLAIIHGHLRIIEALAENGVAIDDKARNLAQRNILLRAHAELEYGNATLPKQ